MTASVSERCGEGHRLRLRAFIEDWGAFRHAIRASYQVDELLGSAAVRGPGTVGSWTTGTTAGIVGAGDIAIGFSFAGTCFPTISLKRTDRSEQDLRTTGFSM